MQTQSLRGAEVLPQLLMVVPTLPVPVLRRLVTRMIDHLDDMEGDPDLEDTREDDEDTHDAEDSMKAWAA